MGDLAAALVQKADGKRRLGALTDAEALLNRALEESHDDVVRADALRELAVVYRRRARYEDAESCARQSVALAESSAPASVVARHLMFLSTLLVADGRDPEALECVERALPLYERALGANHIEIAFVLSVAVRLAQASDRRASARFYERRRLALLRR